MSMLGRWSLPALALFAGGGVLGCFKDGGANDDAGGCNEGSMGCACYGNGTCDSPLECRDDVCVPDGCDAGALDCVCLDGQCVGGLACVDGTCQPDDAETGEASADGTDDTESETTDDPTTGPDDTSTTDPTTGPDDTSTTEPSTTDMTSSTETDTGPGDCDALGDCRDCLDCVGADVCEEQYQACAADDACLAYVDCALACNGDSGCWSGCKGIAPNTYSLGDAWVQCGCDPCAESCVVQAQPACG
jgi:hypothetical protein